MKWLPFTITIGKSLDKMLDEKLEQEDLAHQIERMQKRDNEDFAVKNDFRSLALREILYRDDERSNWAPPDNITRIIVRAYGCGIDFPNCPVTSDDEIHYDKDSSQKQVIISEDALVVRQVYSSGYLDTRPISKILACSIKPFSNLKDHGIDWRLAEAFTREVFDRPIMQGYAERIGSIGGFRDDEDFGKSVYEIRLIVPSESRAGHHYYNLYANIRSELDKLGYKKLEEPLCLA